MNLPILILALSLLAADLPEIPSIGVISPRRSFALAPNTSRPDFVHFVIEVRSDATPTNIVTFTTTNTVLTVMKFARVPSGPGFIGVIATYADGEESEMVLRRYDLRRGRPSAPSIEPVEAEGVLLRKRSLSEELRKIRGVQRVPAPPMPAGITNVARTIAVARPLPGGTNRSYADHLDWMADRSAKGKRRNE